MSAADTCNQCADNWDHCIWNHVHFRPVRFQLIHLRPCSFEICWFVTRSFETTFIWDLSWDPIISDLMWDSFSPVIVSTNAKRHFFLLSFISQLKTETIAAPRWRKSAGTKICNSLTWSNKMTFQRCNAPFKTRGIKCFWPLRCLSASAFTTQHESPWTRKDAT